MLTAGHRLIREMPTDLLQILTGSFGMLALGSAHWLSNGGPGWLWIVLVGSLLATLGAGLPWTVRTYRAPDRMPIKWGWDNRLWFFGLAVVIAATMAGAREMVAGGVSGFLVGTPVFLVGIGVLAMVIRHLRKPIRSSNR